MFGIFADPAHRLITVHLGHHDIHEHGVDRFVLVEQRDRVLAGFGVDDSNPEISGNLRSSTIQSNFSLRKFSHASAPLPAVTISTFPCDSSSTMPCRSTSLSSTTSKRLRGDRA